MPVNNDLSFQIMQIQIGLDNLNPNLPNYDQQRTQLVNQLSLLQMQRQLFSNPYANNSNNPPGGQEQVNNYGNDNIVQSLWQELTNIVSAVWGGVSNSPQADAAQYLAAAGEAGDLAGKAMALATIAPGAVDVALTAEQEAGELNSAFANANAEAEGDLKFEKGSLKVGQPSQ